MRSSTQKKRPGKKSESYSRIGIELLLSSDRAQDKSMMYGKINSKTYDHSHSKRSKVLVELPKIYPIHKKLLNIKMKELQIFKYQNDHRFHLMGSRFLCDMENSDDTTAETQELQRSKISIKKNQSALFQPKACSLWIELILKVNGINEFKPIKNAKLKAFVEQGNNSRLVKELLRKRPQIKLVESKSDADIVWTRFSDNQAVEKGSNYTQKTQKYIKSSTYPEQQNFFQALKSLTQLTDNIISFQNSKSIQISSFFIHNHLKNHEEISDKKNLFKNIRTYCKLNGISQSQIIPRTFHIDCAQFKEQNELETKIEEIFSEKKFNQASFFVVKPGQDTNRGEGITVVRGKQNIKQAVKQLHKKGKSSLIQQYINPLLYRNRKFDIRCYVLVTSTGGQLRAYWYKQGYLRTCVKEFSYDLNNVFGHLTNDAVQKRHKDYGKFEQANKLSFGDLEMILRQTEKSRDNVVEEMKGLAKHSIKAVEGRLRGGKNMFGFEIFGYDFLIDSEGKVWLIEVNTNPCLEFSGSLLSRIIWHMVDNSVRIAIDPFMESQARRYYQNYLDTNKYELII